MPKYPENQNCVDAVYSQPIRVIYRGNPYIEALPDVLNDKALFHALLGPIPYDATERNLPWYERVECVGSLANVFVPLGANGEIARKIYSAIREGYVVRNPLSPEFIKRTKQLQECVINRDSTFMTMANSNANASGFTIVGESGMGKTTAVNRAISLFPQLIIHKEYQGIAFDNVQIVWMRLECPFDGSVKGLCTSFFREFDRLTGDNTFAKFAGNGRATVDQMIPQMGLVSMRHGLGLLIIDEIQNLVKAKSWNADGMLAFINQLVNTIGQPILLVGIPTAIELLSSDLMTARRSTGRQGMTVMEPLAADSPDWYAFTKGIWKYQWTKEETPITPELQQALWKASFGNIDAAVNLYGEAQRLAIRMGSQNHPEIITPQLIEAASKQKSFRMVFKSLEKDRKEQLKSAAQPKMAQHRQQMPETVVDNVIPMITKPALPKKREKKKAVNTAGYVGMLMKDGHYVNANDEF